MKKFNELSYQEQKLISAYFENWLCAYVNEIVVKVLERFEEIYNNEFAMNLIKELYERTQKAREERVSHMIMLIENFEETKQYDIHNNCSEHPNSYRDILFDMYIKDIILNKTK